MPAVRDEVAEALWQAAVQIEDGNLGDAAARLARAKERLQQALREGDATDEEIAQLMDELRQATRDYMEQMAREAHRERRDAAGRDPAGPDHDPGPDPGADGPDPGAVRAGAQGRGRGAARDAAADAREHADDDGPEGGGPGEDGQGQQSMQGLADALREQQGLADDSFQQLQRQFQRGRAARRARARTGSRARRGGEARAATTGRSPSGRRRCAS